MSYDDIHKSVPTDQDDVAIAPTLTPGEPGQHEQDGSLTAAEAKLTHKAKWSDLFTVLASGCALISDGYQNNLMTMLVGMSTAASYKPGSSPTNARGADLACAVARMRRSQSAIQISTPLM